MSTGSSAAAAASQVSTPSVPRGAQVDLAGVSHSYPLSHDLEHGWLHLLLRRFSPAARARYEAEAAATLLPWRTVRDNVALGPEARGRVERDRRRVEAALQIVGLRDFADSYPSTLSGGMAQRASLARALVNRPRLFLLDEPLGKLDALTRLQLQDEILKLWESQRFTAVLVTHDVDEALRLSNRVVVLSERPARIVADIEVPELDESSDEVRELRRKILGLLGR